MANLVMLHAGDTLAKTLTFTVAADEPIVRISLLLTRVQAESEHSSAGRARCLILEADVGSLTPGTIAHPARTTELPRVRVEAGLAGVVPASICGGSYKPEFCTFMYADGRPPTGFEIDNDQRFMVEVVDDAAAFDAGPAIVGFS